MPHSEKPSDKPLLSHEQWESVSRYAPHPRVTFSNPQDIAKALLSNAGRFRSPLSFREKLQLKVFSLSLPLDFFNLSQNFLFKTPSSFIPYPWQVLLRYLQREGLMERGESSFYPLPHDTPKNFFYGTYFSGRVGKKVWNIGGWGNATHSEEALSKSIGEVLERFFFSYVPPLRNVLKASISYMQKKQKVFLNPLQFPSFIESQKKFSPELTLTEKDVLSWIEGTELVSGEKAYIPVQSIFWDPTTLSKEPTWVEWTTSGNAGHFTFEESALNGIYECIERDSFLIYWLNQIAPESVDLTQIESKKLSYLLENLKKYKFEIHFLNITTDIGIPSFVCVIIDRSQGGPKIAIGGGSGWDIEKILEEITYKTLASFKSIAHFRKKSFDLPLSYKPFFYKGIGREERLLFWMNPKTISEIDFFLKGKKVYLSDLLKKGKKFHSLHEELKYVLNIFNNLGAQYKVYVYERRHRILKRLGYHVVRVIVPALVPMYLTEHLAPLAAQRLSTVPQKMGYASAENKNPIPHPFP